MPPKPSSKNVPDKKPAKKPAQVNAAAASQEARISELEARLAKLEAAVRAGIGLNF